MVCKVSITETTLNLITELIENYMTAECIVCMYKVFNEVMKQIVYILYDGVMIYTGSINE